MVKYELSPLLLQVCGRKNKDKNILLLHMRNLGHAKFTNEK
jgi:hypothetical protein